jgi:hypothetical protein
MPKGMGLKVPKANVLRNAVAAKHPYFDTLWLKFDKPAAGVCSPWRHTDTLASNPLDSAVTVTVLSDSSQSHCGIRLLKDPAMAPAVGLRAYIVFTGKPGETYLFKVPAGLFHDIWNNENDSLTISTEYTKPENYGNIAITLLTPSSAPTSTVTVQSSLRRILVSASNCTAQEDLKTLQGLVLAGFSVTHQLNATCYITYIIPNCNYSLSSTRAVQREPNP